MRRLPLVAIAFLLLSSCFRPAFVDPSSVSGTLRPKFGQPRQGTAFCREVRRVPCDKVSCGATGRDFVTLDRSGTDVNRCEISRGEC